jgi:hypothetical protein
MARVSVIYEKLGLRAADLWKEGKDHISIDAQLGLSFASHTGSHHGTGGSLAMES